MLEVGFVIYQFILSGTARLVRRFWAYLLVGFLGYLLGAAPSRPSAPPRESSATAGSAAVVRGQGQRRPKPRPFIEAPGFHFDD